MYIDKSKYQRLTKVNLDKRDLVINALKAFFCGGLVCLLGETLVYLYVKMGLDIDSSKTMMTITIILIAGFLSAFGIYDKIGQFAKAGLLVPISGFANGAISASMEHKSEGILLGLSANVFKLVGAVIVLGVFFGFLVGTLKYLWSLI